jgi:hypothetical protein
LASLPLNCFVQLSRFGFIDRVAFPIAVLKTSACDTDAIYQERLNVHVAAAPSLATIKKRPFPAMGPS